MLTTFLFGLAGGMLVVLATGQFEQIAWKFLRLVTLIVLALSCGPVFWQWRQAGSHGAYAGYSVSALGAATAVAAAALVLLAPFAGTRRRSFAVICLVGGASGLAAACVSAIRGLGGGYAGGPTALIAVSISQIMGSILLGSITVAWLLGHAYLTATRMTIAPLQHFSRVLSLAVAVRMAFGVASLTFAWMLHVQVGASIVPRLLQAWLIVFLRAGVGLIAVAAFAYMVADCVKRRSTQSATGILYFGSIFAYVGELANQHLIVHYGWPI